jgi:glucose-1-phosphate thymidylyltransferase
MWGIIPAAGSGSRIQPLAFSKELLPVGSRLDGDIERPKAVSEYLLERMISGGVQKICFVISPGKSDILEYYGGNFGPAKIVYVVQPNPKGLCDAIFRALPLIDTAEDVLVGLPDTIWFPSNGLSLLPSQKLSFLLFPVQRPEFFDAVLTDADSRVLQIKVKQAMVGTPWIWGAFKLNGAILQKLFELWRQRECEDHYFGNLVNSYLIRGGEAFGLKEGIAYVDVGTLHGYREAIQLLSANVIDTSVSPRIQKEIEQERLVSHYASSF